jgi:hypothetical protein
VSDARPDIEHADDARDVQGRQDLRLADEASADLGASTLARVRHLHRDTPAELGVLGLDDQRPAASRDLAHDAVARPRYQAFVLLLHGQRRARRGGLRRLAGGVEDLPRLGDQPQELAPVLGAVPLEQAVHERSDARSHPSVTAAQWRR